MPTPVGRGASRQRMPIAAGPPAPRPASLPPTDDASRTSDACRPAQKPLTSSSSAIRAIDRLAAPATLLRRHRRVHDADLAVLFKPEPAEDSGQRAEVLAVPGQHRLPAIVVVRVAVDHVAPRFVVKRARTVGS